MSKRIAFLHKPFPFGGAEMVTIRLAGELTLHGYTVYVFCSEYYEKLLDAKPQPFEVIEMPDRSKLQAEANVTFVIEKVCSLGISHLIIATNEYAAVIEKLYVARLCKIIYFQHGQPLWEVRNKLEYSGKSRARNVRIALNRLKERAFRHYTKRWLKVYRKIYNNCDFYVNLTFRYSERIITALHADRKKFVCIPNFVSQQEANNVRKKRQLLYVGRLSYADKRVDRLLHIWREIFQKVPDWELVIVGDGSEKAALQDYSHKHRLPRVRFEGWQTDVSAYFNEASIICLTSTFESFGLCLVEGMQLGCVPVAFNCSAGVEDIVKGYGELVPAFDLQAYANALLQLMTDETYLEACRNRSTEGAKRFSPERIVPQWIELLEK